MHLTNHCKKFRTYNLPMTPDGVKLLINSPLFRMDKGMPQVYIHVGCSAPLNSQVIRIGSAKNGTFERWRSASGHCRTYLYAVGAEEGYSRPWKYPDYLAFFAGLHGLETQIHVVNCDTPSEMKQLESELIKIKFGPIWEQYRRHIKGRRGYFISFPEIGEKFSEFGGALQETDRYRKGDSTLVGKFPDVLDFRSERKWTGGLSTHSAG